MSKQILKAILIDDNKYALLHFSKLVDWEACGFHLSGTAIDGIEGYELFMKVQPDLVITDVQMPGMDGRDLAAKIRGTGSKAYVVFLSSYDEFDYARAAVDLSVNEYLLKQELNQETFSGKLRQFYETIINEKKAGSEAIFSSLLAFSHFSENDASRQFLPAISLPADTYMVVIEQDHMPEWFAMTMHYALSDPDKMKLSMDELLSCIGDSVSLLTRPLQMAPFQYICLITASDADNEVRILYNRFLTSEKAWSLFPLGYCKDTEECARMYGHNQSLYQKRFIKGSQTVMYPDMQEESRPVSPDHSFPSLTEEDLLTDADSVLKIEQIYRKFLIQYDTDGFRRLTEFLLAFMRETCRQYGVTFELTDEEANVLITARSLIQWLEGRLHDCLNLCRSDSSPVAMKAVSYIRSHYSDPMLGLDQIAAASDLSANRLNDLFKKEYHMTVGKYLTAYRMKIARQLLQNGEDVASAAEKTGYTSSTYFSHVYHKTFNISPYKVRRS